MFISIHLISKKYLLFSWEPFQLSKKCILLRLWFTNCIRRNVLFVDTVGYIRYIKVTSLTTLSKNGPNVPMKLKCKILILKLIIIVVLYYCIFFKGPSFIMETTGNLKNVLPSVRTDLYYKSESLKKFDLMRLWTIDLDIDRRLRSYLAKTMVYLCQFTEKWAPILYMHSYGGFIPPPLHV